MINRSDQDNDGSIYVGTGDATNGVPTTIYAQMLLGFNQTQMAQYTVPRRMRLAMKGLFWSSGGSATIITTVGLYVREFGQVFATKNRAQILRRSFERNYTPTFNIPAKADIEMWAVRRVRRSTSALSSAASY